MKKHFEQNSNENTDEKMQYFKDVNFFQIVIYIQCNPHLNSTRLCVYKLTSYYKIYMTIKSTCCIR